MTRSLVVHAGGIGDLLLALPAVAAWRSPEEPLDVAGFSERAELAVLAGMATRAFPLDSLDFSTVYSSPSERFRQAVRGYTRALIFLRDDDGAVVRAFQAAGVEDVRCLPGVPPEDYRLHAADYFSAQLGLPPQPPLQMKLPRQAPAPDVVIHPGSGAARKNWPLENYVALALRLRKAGLHISWIRGPAEEQLSLAGQKVLPEMRLSALARTLAATRCYVGNDTGITHLAAATGCPVIAIFGPTDPAIWAPRGSNVQIIRGEPWPPVEEVAAILDGFSSK